MILRAATIQDAPALAALYGHHVIEGVGTFEETPPSPEQMEARRAAVVVHGLPWLVAELNGRMLGFAYAGPFRMRSAYRHTVEDSVYIAPDVQRTGVGRTLLAAVIARCEAMGLRQMVAVIGDSGNASSIGLHAALGFEAAGVGPGLGYKQGRWLDVVWMVRPLNGGTASLPAGPGLDLG
ncbi:GNAT family N-acetyltransferase [Phenylobacterium sp.]|uniref:GNAT family N-acetyltransferase n=1 Tax=Phenylobacterium sp. TaxID=1871053 RepID=UPI00273502B6|nr:GNAT family N-acetyltransferase [Phenylobacterium sp.]MDP3660579.1 N-acetyltransferase family protein [Phenylobacterium sp.]